jgi:tripartite-type tricarboxylate transporter receptor subunit TctC
MKLPQRRQFLHLAAGAAALPAVSRIARAQTYPSRPITIVAPFPAGGATDIVSRTLAEGMKAPLGQTILVENVTGASGTIGSGRVVRAEPDGYTLVIGQWSSHVGAGVLYRLPYHVLHDFEPISVLTTSPLWILGKNDLPAKDLKELIAWLKANPDKASVATVGAGSASHMCMVYFQDATGTRFQYVPYRGAAPVMQDLIAGQVDLSCLEAGQTLANYRAGKFRVFAVMAKQRFFPAPDVPTVDEAGTPGLHFPFWHGMWAPKGTPKPVIARLNAAVAAAFTDPATQRRFRDVGMELPSREQQTPEALYAHHKAEIDKWWPIIRAANIKAE